MRSALLALFALLAVSLSSRAAVVYVSLQAPGPAHDGASWQTAFLKVQDAVYAAQPDDEVWVASGTYQETITLQSGVGLYGGFAGTESLRSQRDPAKNQTTLDAQAEGTVVTIAQDATSGTVVDGFSLVNGLGPVRTGYPGSAGGGIYIAGGTPVISHNTIANCILGNYEACWGGGILSDKGASPVIAGNTFLGNGASEGGAIFAYGGLIRDNYFAHNQALGAVGWVKGGAIDAEGPAVIVHNVFEFNKEDSWYGGGGGGGVWGRGAMILDNLFHENRAEDGNAIPCFGNSTVVRNVMKDADPAYNASIVASFAGGVFANNLIVTLNCAGLGLGPDQGNADGTRPVITNNTFVQSPSEHPSYAVANVYAWGENPVFANNLITGWAGAGYNSSASHPNTVYTTDHNNLYGNTANTLPWPGAAQVGMNGTISQDPLFTDPANGDYTLKAGSPCIDAGNDAYVKSTDRDLAGAPRIYGAHVDIGAYEFGSPAWTMQDAAEVLKTAAGLSLAAPAEVSRLDTVPGGGLTLTDATRIAQWLLN